MATFSPKARQTALPAPHTLLVVFAAIGFGTVPFFAKSLTEAGMAPAAVAFYRYTFAAIVLSPFLRWGKEQRAITLWGIATGVILGIGWTGYVRALETMPVSTVGVIYMTYPVFTILTGWLFFRERPSARALIGAGMIMAAAIVATTPAAVGVDALPSLLVALLAPLSFGLAINILTSTLVGIPPLSRIACVSLGSVLGLLPLIATSDLSAVVPASAHDWGLVVGIALATALIPQLIYTIHAPMIGAARTAMAGSAELPTMFVVGWLAFGERLTVWQLAAGILVVSAIAITPSRRVRNVTSSLATSKE